MNPLDRERLLLTLSLECAAAKESLAFIESFKRFFQSRLQPKQQDYEECTLEFAKGFENEIVQMKGSNAKIVLSITVPIIFTLENCAGEVLSRHEIDVLTKIVQAFREKCEALAELKGLTYTDDLTGLYNQRYLELILDRELSLSKRNDTAFSVLFLDLDHFKMVNDSHGHLIGSRLLYEVGQEIKKTLRESDITFRYGGDEFVMILSHTALDDAMFVAERVRLQIEKKRFLVRDGMELRLTASIGVACVPDHADSKAQILKAADEALYGVKKAVRNRVIAATAKG